MHRLTLIVLLLVSFSLTGLAQNRNDNWLNGTWEGTGYQIDNNTNWTMRVSVLGKKYSIEYPSLKCGGEWRLVSMNLQEATFVEKITYGKERCTDDGNVVVERLNENQVAFRYSLTNSTDVVASAILRRR